MDRTGNLARALTAVFWLAAAATVAWLILSGLLAEGLVGPRASETVFTALMVTVALTSGLILRREWQENPVGESERGEWTNTQLFFSIIFATSFFVAFLSLAGWFFSA